MTLFVQLPANHRRRLAKAEKKKRAEERHRLAVVNGHNATNRKLSSESSADEDATGDDGGVSVGVNMLRI